MADRRPGVKEALSDSDVLGSLTEPELDRLIPYGIVHTHRPGEVIFQKGDPGESLMVVLHGRVKIGSVSIDGRESLLTFIEPGASFGEIALLDGKPRSADATAVEPTELFVLRRKDLLGYLERHPEIALRIIGVLCARIRRITEMAEDATLLNMTPRIARAILRLAAEYGQVADGTIRLGLKLSQRELGCYIGLARENVNRQLGAWRQNGVIAVEGGHIVIRDPARLKAIAREVDS
jgi:CRP-like cAMP-binding protein